MMLGKTGALYALAACLAVSGLPTIYVTDNAMTAVVTVMEPTATVLLTGATSTYLATAKPATKTNSESSEVTKETVESDNLETSAEDVPVESESSLTVEPEDSVAASIAEDTQVSEMPLTTTTDESTTAVSSTASLPDWGVQLSSLFSESVTVSLTTEISIATEMAAASVSQPATEVVTDAPVSTQLLTVTVTEASVEPQPPTVTLVVTVVPSSSESLAIPNTITLTVTESETSSPAPELATVAASSSSQSLPAVTVTVTETTSEPIVRHALVSCSDLMACPAGTEMKISDGKPLSCIATFYDEELNSSTCDQATCCTSASSQVSGVNSLTTCKDFKFQCPAGETPAVDMNGVSVSCLMTFQNSQMTQTTCTQFVCCSKVAGRGANNSYAPEFNGKERDGKTEIVTCDKAVKCKKYRRNGKNKKVLSCDPREGMVAHCDESLCCKA